MNSKAHHCAGQRQGVTDPAAARESDTQGPINAATLAAHEKRGGSISGLFTPLERETRAALDTESAAHHLNREPQTLRVWACRQSGPIRPLRIHGRLAWPTDAIRQLLGVAQ